MTSDVRTTRNRRVISSLVSLAALAWTPVALADDAGPPRDNLWDGNWHWGIAFYGWLPGVSLDARYQLPSGAADTKTNNNIFSYLSGAFMMTAEARQGDWGIFGDFDWVKFSNEKGRFREIAGENLSGNVTLDTSWGLKGGMITLAGLYNWNHSPVNYNDFIFGGRYLWIKGNLDWNFGANGTGGLDIANSGSAHRSDNVFDAIVGLKGRWMFTDDYRWYVPYYIDVGAGSNNWTAQAIVGIGYRFDWGDLGLDWRTTVYKGTGNGDFLRRLDLSGPMFRASWYF